MEYTNAIPSERFFSFFPRVTLAPVMAISASIDLLIGQYRAAEVLRGAVQTFIDALRIHIDEPLARLELMRQIDEAEGVWLDYIGRRVGLRRPYSTRVATDPRFGFDEAGTGFGQAPFAGDAVNDATGPIGDPMFRRFIRARAILLHGDGTLATFERAAQAIDPGARVADQFDMRVRVSTAIRWQFELADSAGALPRNAGVGIIYAERGRFGFDEAGVGFDLGPFSSGE